MVNTLEDAIEIKELPHDREEMYYIARRMEHKMHAKMRGKRSVAEVTADLFNGGVAERDVARHINSPRNFALDSCLTQQNLDGINPGPDLLDINVKCTDLDSQGVTLKEAFDRDFRLFVRYGMNGLHADTKAYVLVFRSKGKAWIVGWATKEEVLASKSVTGDGALTLRLSQLRTPETFIQRYP
jgi:hypothetical protein